MSKIGVFTTEAQRHRGKAEYKDCLFWFLIRCFASELLFVLCVSVVKVVDLVEGGKSDSQNSGGGEFFDWFFERATAKGEREGLADAGDVNRVDAEVEQLYTLIAESE